MLLVLAAQGAEPKTPQQIRELAVGCGLRAAKKWNISCILSRYNPLAIRVASGWELGEEGRPRVGVISGISLASPAAKTAVDLRAHLATLHNPDTLAFLGEAVSCLETGLLRAAGVLSWVGAVSVLYGHVVMHHLPTFNVEATRRDVKWKAAKTADDLGRLKEHEFLNILEAISVIGKNVKQELQNSLALRNACGHPNSLQIGSNRVASHIEILILTVFSKY